MKRKRLSEGEIRFRVSAVDRKRIDWLLQHHPNEYHSVSALLRALIYREHDALINVHVIKED